MIVEGIVSGESVWQQQQPEDIQMGPGDGHLEGPVARVVGAGIMAHGVVVAHEAVLGAQVHAPPCAAVPLLASRVVAQEVAAHQCLWVCGAAARAAGCDLHSHCPSLTMALLTGWCPSRCTIPSCWLLPGSWLRRQSLNKPGTNNCVCSSVQQLASDAAGEGSNFSAGASLSVNQV